ncbi:MAG: type II secretion system F family protein, partial [Methylococcales bacterium]|nr:type II secretion system F family protein [Methylococcales bacterium]
MPFSSYKARNSQGELVEGVLESENTMTVAKQLSSLGITPVEISLEQKPAIINLFEEKIEAIDLMMFSRQMYTLLK